MKSECMNNPTNPCTMMPESNPDMFQEQDNALQAASIASCSRKHLIQLAGILLGAPHIPLVSDPPHAGPLKGITVEVLNVEGRHQQPQQCHCHDAWEQKRFPLRAASTLQDAAMASCSRTVSHSASRHPACSPLHTSPRLSACRLSERLEPNDAISMML